MVTGTRKGSKLIRWMIPIVLGVFLGPAVYVEWSLREPAGTLLSDLDAGDPDAGDSMRVYVVVWDYHTSILVEQPPGERLGPPGYERAPLVEYAWGDRRFYMESNYLATPLTLFWPTESVTYIRGWNRHSVAGDPDPVVYFRKLSPGEWLKLVNSLEDAIAYSGDTRMQAYPPTPGYRGRFYPGSGWYLWTYTCNRWTVERLQDVSLAHSGFGVILARQVPGRLIGFRRLN